MEKVLKQKLIEHWTGTLKCNVCKLPQQFTPQFRPVGSMYKLGGVAFIQINPGVIGILTDIEIQNKYKKASNGEKARRKNNVTKHLQQIEKMFLKSPSSDTWNDLCSEYFMVMREVWGWPPGRYANTIENHGIKLDNVAVVNLSQCPIENNKYKTGLFDKCWEKQTSQVLKILRPKILIAQGKTVLKYLQDNYTDKDITITEGVHHASRASKTKKDILFKNVKKLLSSA